MTNQGALPPAEEDVVKAFRLLNECFQLNSIPYNVATSAMVSLIATTYANCGKSHADLENFFLMAIRTTKEMWPSE
jgi:hypothetical protein